VLYEICAAVSDRLFDLCGPSYPDSAHVEFCGLWLIVVAAEYWRVKRLIKAGLVHTKIPPYSLWCTGQTLHCTSHGHQPRNQC
jgi:hypothetical protein